MALFPARTSRVSTRRADAFVLPAARETYGTAWGEAMALGLPVVGWRTGNVPHPAQDEREGLLLEPGNVEALSQALLRLALDRDVRARLGAAAKRRALARPTWEDSAASFFAAIRESLGEHRAGSSRFGAQRGRR